MRNQTVGTVSLAYPDAYVWAGDNMIITATGTTDPVALKLVIGYGQANYRTLEYHSISTFLAIDMRSAVIAYCESNGYGNVSIQTTVYEGGVTQGVIYTTGMFIFHGITRADRYHGSSEYILQPVMPASDNNPVDSVTELFALGAGTYVGAGSGTAPTGCSIVGYTGCTGSCGFVYTSAQIVGDFNNPEIVTMVKNEVEKVDCLPENGIIMRYYNTDGCIRYAIGRVISRSVKVTREAYNPALSELNMLPSAIKTAQHVTIRVGFENVRKSQHLDDMFLSEHIYIVNPTDRSTREVVPDVDGVDVDELKGGELIVEFITQQ